MRALSSLALFAAACSCPRPDPGAQLHYAEYGPLTHAVVQGDRAAIADLAPRLDGGNPVRDATAVGYQAELDLHSAAGFLMVTLYDNEAGEGLAAVARSCGDCHQAQGVRYGGSSSGSTQQHDRRFDQALHALERGDPAGIDAALVGLEAVSFPEGGASVAVGAQELRTALLALEGAPDDRLEGAVGVVYGACAGCHGRE